MVQDTDQHVKNVTAFQSKDDEVRPTEILVQLGQYFNLILIRYSYNITAAEYLDGHLVVATVAVGELQTVDW